MNRSLIKIFLSSLFVFVLVTFAMSQAAPPPPPPAAPSGPVGVPIDGGLGLLAAAGIGYGATRYRKFQKNKNNKA